MLSAVFLVLAIVPTCPAFAFRSSFPVSSSSLHQHSRGLNSCFLQSVALRLPCRTRTAVEMSAETATPMTVDEWFKANGYGQPTFSNIGGSGWAQQVLLSFVQIPLSVAYYKALSELCIPLQEFAAPLDYSWRETVHVYGWRQEVFREDRASER